MIKNRIYAALASILFVGPCATHAAYPVYQAKTNQQYQQQLQNPNAYIQAAQMQNRAAVGVMPTQGQVIMQPNQIVVANTAVAAQPTRITGALPRVGSNATAAGRQYYQPADFDRLADSGLYIGLSAGYAMSVMGGMNADYKGEETGAFVPGSWEKGTWDSDTVFPLEISVGAAINSDIRVDFSFTRYSGMAYPGTAMISDGDKGTLSAPVSGGATTANVTMLNMYYNIDSYTGYLAGGSLRPYVGLGLGLSLNSIADYVIYDASYYPEPGELYEFDAGQLTGVSDVYAYHNGGTTENFAFSLEGGVTTDMGGGLKLDFFVRYANLGNVKTSGSIILSQTEWLSDGAGDEYPGPYDAVYHYTNWYESGRLSVLDVGVRLRLQF